MIKNFLVIGFGTVASFLVLSSTSEAGHRHRAKRVCAPASQTCCDSVNSGYSAYQNGGSINQLMQTYGFNNYVSPGVYNSTGINGNFGARTGQGNFFGNGQGNTFGNGTKECNKGVRSHCFEEAQATHTFGCASKLTEPCWSTAN